jgi:hypothetical protein
MVLLMKQGVFPKSSKWFYDIATFAVTGLGKQDIILVGMGDSPFLPRILAA